VTDLMERNRNRFWLTLQEPGCVPERKGPWLNTGMAVILREFMEARPTAYINILTVNDAGEPQIEHGPEWLQMLDGRSMGTGRRHNEQTRAAHADSHAALIRACK
jgi:hypothetical protein